MDFKDLRTHQQIEFFLLHNLLINDLKLLKRTKRITPAGMGAVTPKQREAAISRLFRSFLTNVFPKSDFVVKKTARREEFVVCFSSEICNRISDVVRIAIQTDETEKAFLDLRGSAPSILVVRIGYGDFYYRPYLKEFGIGKHCAAVNAVLSWKKRFDIAITATDTPKIAVPNRAQEEIDALFEAARREGRI